MKIIIYRSCLEYKGGIYMENNATSGNLLKHIAFFAIPYLLSYFLQTLYGMADLFIVGQFNAVDGITAVSNGSQVMHMLTAILVGLAMGVTVSISHAVGAKKHKLVEKTIGNTITLFACISIVSTILLLIFVKPLVVLLNVPQDAMTGTVQYLVICFIGIPFITAYNIISSIYRGLGDSKSPMYIIAIACLLNIVLDYLFIGLFHMGPIGAALGTTVSQSVSVIIALISMRYRTSDIHIKKEDLHLQPQVFKQILKVGFPVAIQDGCIQIGFIIITIIANSRGLNDAAAVGIVEKMITAIFIIPSTMLATVSALSAQNIGAKDYGRARTVLKYAVIIATLYGIIVALIVECAAPTLLGLFTKDTTVILLGAQYISSYIIDTIFAGVHFSFSGYFAADGKSYIGFIHNIISLSLVRVPGSYIASIIYPHNLFPMGLAAPLGSLLSVIICLIAYRILKKKDELSVL